jgi:hypothetical protein
MTDYGVTILPVEMNKEKWSESSKRSFSYSASTETHYVDFAYRCVKCTQRSVFSAEDQKIEYEVNRRFIWQKRTLCADCHVKVEELRNKDMQFQNEWNENKKVRKSDRQFLCDWLVILEEIPSYGKKSHRDLITALKKLTYACV